MEYQICVVEDSLDLLNVYCEILKKVGKPHGFRSPAEFLGYLKENPEFHPDIVITDHTMPGMSGLEMLQQAQTKESFFPSVLISGYLDKEMAIEASNIGVWRILEKPINKQMLLDTVTEILCEHDFHRIRQEIRWTMNQIQELFAAFRILCMDELEMRASSNPMMGPDGQPTSSLDQAISEMEARLEKLSESEANLKFRLKKNQLARGA